MIFLSRDYSSVSSPGFPSRVVRRASAQDGWNKSPFQYSPNKNLELGQIPYGSKWRGNISPSSLRLASPIYSATAELCKRDSGSTNYVAIKPLDPDRSFTGYLNFDSKKGNGLGGTPAKEILFNSPNQLLASANNILSKTRSLTQTSVQVQNNMLSLPTTSSSMQCIAPSSILEALATRKR